MASEREAVNHLIQFSTVRSEGRDKIAFSDVDHVQSLANEHSTTEVIIPTKLQVLTFCSTLLYITVECPLCDVERNAFHLHGTM